FPLSLAFPRLEQLWIGPNLPYLDPAPGWMWREKAEDIWPHLKVLIFDPTIFIGQTSGAQGTYSTLWHLTRLTSLQHITLQLGSGDWPCMFSDNDDLLSDNDDLLSDNDDLLSDNDDLLFDNGDLLSDYDIARCSEFPNLHSFSSQTMCISPNGARALLSNGIKSKRLTSFDIVFPCEDYMEHASLRHLKGYDWLRGAPSIDTLSCYGIDLQSTLVKDGRLFLPRFLATFPNLRTLDIVTCDYPLHLGEEFVSLVIAIMRLTHLKTIYMASTSFAEYYHPQLRQVARDHGVRLRSGPRILQWPMPLLEK
ncbi:hypothetical protein E4U11_005617, partial [Claviceps purpurea]